MAVAVLPIIAGILVLGICVQPLARRLGVPSVLFLILVGLAVGEAGLGLVALSTFGEGLSVVRDRTRRPRDVPRRSGGRPAGGRPVPPARLRRVRSGGRRRTSG